MRQTTKKMLLITALCSISLAFIVVSELAQLENQKTSFRPSEHQIAVFEGNITFKCGKVPMSVYLKEHSPDIDDDFEDKAVRICNDTISDAVDWNNRTYKQNSYGHRSFDEHELNLDTCKRQGMSYDKNLRQCYQENAE